MFFGDPQSTTFQPVTTIKIALFLLFPNRYSFALRDTDSTFTQALQIPSHCIIDPFVLMNLRVIGIDFS